MNCAEVQNQIDRWSPEGGKATLPAELAAHVAGCEPCTEYCQDRVFATLVRSVSNPPIPVGLEERIIKVAQFGRAAPGNVIPIRSGPARTETGRGAAMRWVVSMAASLFLAVGLALLYFESGPQNVSQPLSTVGVSVDEVKEVRVMFATQKALSNARLHIGLPQHVSLAGYEGVRELSWQTDLKPGNNMITLPVHMLAPKDGLIEVTLEHEGAKKTVTISVTVENHDPIRHGYRHQQKL